jgi:hypothetical protein
VARSHISGEEIPPGQVRPARLTIGDETREVKLSADEAGRALDDGEESSRWIRLLRKWGPRVLGGFLALLLIPAITGQWADRTKEVEVQRDLVTQMSEAAATAIGTMRLVGQNLLPEAQRVDLVAAIRAYLYNSEFAAGDLEALRLFADQLQQSALPEVDPTEATATADRRRSQGALYAGRARGLPEGDGRTLPRRAATG